MLILHRKRGEAVVIGGNIVVKFVGVNPDGSVKLAITAPPEVPIFRGELVRDGQTPRSLALRKGER